MNCSSMSSFIAFLMSFFSVLLRKILSLKLRVQHSRWWNNYPIQGGNVSFVFLKLNTRCECLFCSGSWMTLTGRSLEQEVNQGWLHSLYPRDRKKVLKKILTAITDKRNPSCEFRILNREGEPLWVRLDGKLDYDKAGNVRGVLSRITNIHHQKMNEKRFLLKIKDSENRAKNNRKSLLHMSHEIRTPLSIIMGFIGLLKEESLDHSNRKEALSSIFHSSQMLNELINNFLELSKMESGEITLHYEPTDIEVFLGEIQSIFKANMERKNIEFKVLRASSLPKEVCLDPMRVRQVLVNLIGNSFKFTEKGFVHLKVCWEDTKSRESGGLLRFAVIDSGRGISPKEQKNLFKDFSQVHSPCEIYRSLKSQNSYGNHEIHFNRGFLGGSSGLGLALCKKLAHKMDGDIRLKFSRPLKENRFDFEIPLRKGTTSDLVLAPVSISASSPSLSPPLPPSPASAPPPPLSPLPAPTSAPISIVNPVLTSDSYYSEKKKFPFFSSLSVLLVEDSIESQKLFKIILSKIDGMKVDVADCGKEALQKALSYTYDVILMDIELPDLKGTEVTLQLRQKGYKKPIIALTAHAIKETKGYIMSFGFSGYLTKPIQPGQLIQALQDPALFMPSFEFVNSPAMANTRADESPFEESTL